MTKADIYKANDKVSIYDACKLIGMPISEYAYNSKMYCPFGDVTHADAGATPAFRVFHDSNAAYCFACSKQYRPVSIIALYHDIPEEEAAQYLLEMFQIGYSTPDDKWNALTKEPDFVLNSADLADSLKRFCQRIDPDWETHQFEPDIAELYDKCLKLLPLIRSEAEVEKWREAAKKVMTQRLVPHE